VSVPGPLPAAFQQPARRATRPGKTRPISAARCYTSNITLSVSATEYNSLVHATV